MTMDASPISEQDIAWRQYSNALQMALGDYQYIEETLRMYVAAAYELIRVRVGDKLPFQLSYKDLENDSLGRLLDKYAKLTANEDLVKRLKALVKERNVIAHRGLLLTSEEHNDIAFLDATSSRLTDLHNQLKPCLLELLNEQATVFETRVLSSNPSLERL